MGSHPDWYPLFIAAKECNCAVWELLDQPVYWQDKGLIKHTAEAQARDIIAKRK